MELSSGSYNVLEISFAVFRFVDGQLTTVSRPKSMDDMKAVTSNLKPGTYLSDAMLKVYTNWEEEKNTQFFGQFSKLMTNSDAKRQANKSVFRCRTLTNFKLI